MTFARNSRRRSAALALFVIAAPAFSQQPAQAAIELILNGGFEAPVLPFEGSQEITWDPIFPNLTPLGDPSIFKWSISSAPGSVRGGINLLRGPSGPDVSVIGDAAEGFQYIDLDGSPGRGRVSQSFATTPGTEYTLSFQYANNYDGKNPQIVDHISALVELLGDGGADLIAAAMDSGVITHNTSDEGDLMWSAFSYLFTANSNSTTLRFTSTTTFGGQPSDANWGILLDKVSVMGPDREVDENEAAPEPAALAVWSLLGTGVAAVAALKRRKRA